MSINVDSKQLEQILFEELQAVLLAEGRKDDAKKPQSSLKMKLQMPSVSSLLLIF